MAFLPRGGRAGLGMRLEGGDGGTPPPDPQLIDAQVRNLGIQGEMIQQIIANAKEMAPLQTEQTQFALDASKTAWQQSQQDRDYALERRGQLTNLQNQLVSDAEAFNTDAKAEELAGKASADVSQAFESARRTQSAEMSRMGVNPADGKFGASSDMMAAGEALATASGKNNARTQAREEGRRLTQVAAGVMAGYPGMGQQTTAATAQFGAASQAIANNGLAGLNGGLAQAGQMANQGASTAGNIWGQQAGAYGQAQASEGAATGQLVGAGLSAAAIML
ncbi:MAG: hypothetical protein RR800_00345 [Comamonas sp.]